MPSINQVVSVDDRLSSQDLNVIVTRLRKMRGMPDNPVNQDLGETMTQRLQNSSPWTRGDMVMGSGQGGVKFDTYKRGSVQSMSEAAGSAWTGHRAQPEHRITYGLGSTARKAYDYLTHDGAWFGDRHPALGFLQGGALAAPLGAGATWLYNNITGDEVGYRWPTVLSGLLGAAAGATRGGWGGGDR